MSNLEQVRVQVDQCNATLREQMRSIPREVVAELGLELIDRVRYSKGVNLEGVIDALALVGYANIIANMVEVEESNSCMSKAIFTNLDEGFGCGCMLIGCGVMVTLILWGAQGFPGITR